MAGHIAPEDIELAVAPLDTALSERGGDSLTLQLMHVVRTGILCSRDINPARTERDKKRNGKLRSDIVDFIGV